MAIDLSKETLGFAAYYGYSKKLNPDATDDRRMEHWQGASANGVWRESWEAAAREAIEENARRLGAQPVESASTKPSIDILAITRACSA